MSWFVVSSRLSVWGVSSRCRWVCTCPQPRRPILFRQIQRWKSGWTRREEPAKYKSAPLNSTRAVDCADPAKEGLGPPAVATIMPTVNGSPVSAVLLVRQAVTPADVRRSVRACNNR